MEQTAQIEQLQIANDSLQSDNIKLKESLADKEQEYQEIQKELAQMLEQFKDSLKQAKQDFEEFQKTVPKDQRIDPKDDGYQETEYEDESIRQREYHIIAGAFKNKGNAKRMADLIQIPDHQPSTVYNKVLKVYYVSLGKHYSYNAAKDDLKSLKRTTEFKDAWIYIKSD